jgi:hypothetical protein
MECRGGSLPTITSKILNPASLLLRIRMPDPVEQGQRDNTLLPLIHTPAPGSRRARLEAQSLVAEKNMQLLRDPHLKPMRASKW